MYQSTTVVGHLGRAPEMRFMPDGTAVTNFSVAASRRWRSRETDELVTETTWFRVQVWGRQAETCHQYLETGSKVLVEGRLLPDPHTGAPRLFTRQDGTLGTSFELRANLVRFLGAGPEEEAGDGAGADEARLPAETATARNGEAAEAKEATS